MCCQVADGGVAVQLLMTMLLCVVCQVADGGVAVQLLMTMLLCLVRLLFVMLLSGGG